MLKRLLRDLGAQAALVCGREVVSVFLGGGTPSLFSPAAIGRCSRRRAATCGWPAIAR